MFRVWLRHTPINRLLEYASRARVSNIFRIPPPGFAHCIYRIGLTLLAQSRKSPDAQVGALPPQSSPVTDGEADARPPLGLAGSVLLFPRVCVVYDVIIEACGT